MGINKIVLCVLFFVGLGFGQMGGGSSSSYSGSSTNPFSSFYTYERTYSCEDHCYGNEECIQKCKTSNHIFLIIFLSILGSIFLCVIGYISYVKCHGRNRESLRSQFVKPQPETISPQQFLTKRDQMLKMINYAQGHETFYFEEEGEKRQVYARAHAEKEEPGNTWVKLEGRDYKGRWDGYGNIFCLQGGMFFWMYKEYNSRFAARQLGQLEDLIYLSEDFDPRTGMTGWYFYPKVENSSQDESSKHKLRGKWKLGPIPLGEQNNFGVQQSSPVLPLLQNQNQNLTPQSLYKSEPYVSQSPTGNLNLNSSSSKPKVSPNDPQPKIPGRIRSQK